MLLEVVVTLRKEHDKVHMPNINYKVILSHASAIASKASRVQTGFGRQTPRHFKDFFPFLFKDIIKSIPPPKLLLQEENAIHMLRIEVRKD